MADGVNVGELAMQFVRHSQKIGKWASKEPTDPRKKKLKKLISLLGAIGEKVEEIKKNKDGVKRAAAVGVIIESAMDIMIEIGPEEWKEAIKAGRQYIHACANTFAILSWAKTLADCKAAGPAAACTAAWGGAQIGEKAIDIIRWLDPNLDTDASTKEHEKRVFANVAGGTAIGASVGGSIGVIGGPPGIAAGVAIGGMVGSVAGLVKEAIEES